MKSKHLKNGRTKDLKLSWLIKEHGVEWLSWQSVAQEWIALQETNLAGKLSSLHIFFDLYLVKKHAFDNSFSAFFEGNANGQITSTEELKKTILDNTNRSDNHDTAVLINYIISFIDWLIIEHFSVSDDLGKSLPLYMNPFRRLESKFSIRTETIHNPLPYRYICDLRKILCPQPLGNFSDWIWAQQNQDTMSHRSRDWFEVHPNLIDKHDQDCVWRVRNITRKGKNLSVYQIWSPVAAMALFLKLELPLRTYQVRMLDSGEADRYRYENGIWIKNLNQISKNSFSKGVFRQFKDNISGLDSTGLYISTNKTADQNKEHFEKGYEIPWQNEKVLYWLEKLRNWQEKYNPISKPEDWTTLESKHTGSKRSHSYLSAMGYSCFLFRDASANKETDRTKPIIESPLSSLWYKLLSQLECDLYKQGHTLSDGVALKLVHDYGKDYQALKTKTDFPLHSLRVSLITCYIMEAKLPLPVVAKLLAGHSRILMTVYYTKITPTVMKQKLKEADERLENNAQDSLKIFLKDAEMRQIQCNLAFKDDQSIQIALANKNPIGWENRYHGLCLAGGNTVTTTLNKSVAGCWNGGELMNESDQTISKIYGAVAHGPENCVRCRWFVTDARYLPALTAHLNFLSYKAHEAANLALNREHEIQKLEERKYLAELNSIPFLHHYELQELQRCYEKQMIEADEFTKDWIATFNLIRRLVEIEKNRTTSDQTNKLVAVGSSGDIKIGFMETSSELLHLSLICDDAEIYPDLLDDVKKTSLIQDRSQKLSRVMLKAGFKPYLLLLNKEQQMMAANAMMRQMVLQSNHTDKLAGFKTVSDYLELEEFTDNSFMLETGIQSLKLQVKNEHPNISFKALNYLNLKVKK